MYGGVAEQSTGALRVAGSISERIVVPGLSHCECDRMFVIATF